MSAAAPIPRPVGDPTTPSEQLPDCVVDPDPLVAALLDAPDAGMQTFSVLQAPPDGHDSEHALSTTSLLKSSGLESGGSMPAHEITDVQYETSVHFAPPVQSASVMQLSGEQCGPPWHVAGSDPSGQLAGGDITTSAEALKDPAISADIPMSTENSARFILLSLRSSRHAIRLCVLLAAELASLHELF